MMEDYISLNDKGYFNKGILGTSYDQSVQLMATGKAGMMVMGNWALPGYYWRSTRMQIWECSPCRMRKRANRYTCRPRSRSASAQAQRRNIQKRSRNISISGRSLRTELLLKQAQAFPVFTDVNPDLSATLKELVPYLNVGTYNFLDQKWPQGVQDTMFTGIQNVLVDGGKTYSIDKMLKEMDKVFTEKKAQ